MTPRPGDTFTAVHTCTLHPTPLSAAFDAERVVPLTDGSARVETHRCDGTTMAVVYGSDGEQR